MKGEIILKCILEGQLQDIGVKTINGMSSDVILTGADIQVSGSDETKIDAALSNKVSINGGEINDTMNNVIQPGRWTVAVPGNAPGNPPELQHGGTLFGFLDVYVQGSPSWIMQVFSPADNVTYVGNVFIRKNINNAGWTNWYCFATATPPQEYDLPLATGITNITGTTSRYWKNQDSTVHVEISVQSASELAREALIGTLPVGFIPAKNQPRIATPGAFVTILTTGEIRLFTEGGGTLKSNQWICMEFNYAT